MPRAAGIVRRAGAAKFGKWSAEYIQPGLDAGDDNAEPPAPDRRRQLERHRGSAGVEDRCLVVGASQRDLTGAVLAANADVNPGQEVYFVLYVDNITNFAAYRLTIQDAIDEAQFTYVADSLETTSVVSGADAATRWAGIWTPQTDALGGPDDEASILDTGGPPDSDLLTVGDVTGQANQFLQIPAQTQWAIRFRVRVD